MGQFIGAPTWYIHYVCDVEVAEAVALCNGLFLANIMGCSKVVAESDYSQVI